MDYESMKSMSDFEVNKMVARFKNLILARHQGSKVSLTVFDDKIGEWYTFNPCNNPSDAWPIILNNGISINKWHLTDESWTADIEHPNACDEYNTIEVEHENPLRAAMICFLLMKDAENENCKR